MQNHHAKSLKNTMQPWKTKRLRQEAEAAGRGISVTFFIAFGSLFSLDVFGLSFSLHVFGLPCSMKIIRHRRRREEAESNVVQFTVISWLRFYPQAFLSLFSFSNFAGAAWGAADYVWHFRLYRLGQFSQFHSFNHSFTVSHFHNFTGSQF